MSSAEVFTQHSIKALTNEAKRKWLSCNVTLYYWTEKCKMQIINPGPAEPGYTLPLQTVQIQISWLLKKPTDLDLHCLPLSMWIYSNNPDQIFWLAEN